MVCNTGEGFCFSESRRSESCTLSKVAVTEAAGATAVPGFLRWVSWTWSLPKCRSGHGVEQSWEGANKSPSPLTVMKPEDIILILY